MMDKKYVHEFRQITGVVWNTNEASMAYLVESVQLLHNNSV